MFGQLDGYDRILVSGPQRSGTRFCSQLIAEELCQKYIDERDFGIDDRRRLGRILSQNTRPLVIHCPGLMHVLQEYACPTTMIVVMLRDTKAIRRSMERIGWNYEGYERAKYAEVWHNSVPATIQDIVDLKYYIWEWRQKGLIENFQEIDFDCLQAHPRWCPAEKRQHFGPRQTQ